MITKFKIFENADEVFIEDDNVWTYYDGRAFAYNTLTNSVKIGEVGEIHDDQGMWHPGNSNEDNWYWHGRLWEEPKLLAFWYYPNPELFKDIINQIEKQLDIHIWNNGWRIQVYKDNNNEVIIGDYYDNSQFRDTSKKLISIEEYMGSEDAPDEELLAHLKKQKK